MAASHTSATHATATGLIPTGGVSLTLPEALSFAEWADVGRELARSRNRIQWLVGDWWRFGAHRYGQRRLAVEQWGGPSFLTSENYGWVAGAFAETSRRREVLTFSHHAEVAALDPADADALLDWCLDMPAGSRRSVHELRIEVRRRQAPPPQQITVEISPAAPNWSRFTFGAPLNDLPSTPQPAPALAALDTSGAGPVPPELAELAVAKEPLPPFDRVAAASAALAALDFKELRGVIITALAALDVTERRAVISAALAIASSSLGTRT